ncbi:hypothetical protein D6779_04020 [Candidatus Parcubacteria bacterium]|nr:MAG: hypothetical protein D6779_04020 [Candidatus Parcubacteria bacterium]
MLAAGIFMVPMGGFAATQAPQNAEVLSALQAKIDQLQQVVQLLAQQIAAMKERTRQNVQSELRNEPPVVQNKVLAASAPANWVYVYDLRGVDPDGDPLSYSLVRAPEGMQILSLKGTLYWVPTLRDVRSEPYEVVVKVSDGKTATFVRYFLKVYAPPTGYYAVLPSGPSASTIAEAPVSHSSAPRQVALKKQEQQTPAAPEAAPTEKQQAKELTQNVANEEEQEKKKEEQREKNGAAAVAEGESPTPPSAQSAAAALASGISPQKTIGALLVLAAIALAVYAYWDVIKRKWQELGEEPAEAPAHGFAPEGSSSEQMST